MLRVWGKYWINQGGVTGGGGSSGGYMEEGYMAWVCILATGVHSYMGRGQ